MTEALQTQYAKGLRELDARVVEALCLMECCTHRISSRGKVGTLIVCSACINKAHRLLKKAQIASAKIVD